MSLVVWQESGPLPQPLLPKPLPKLPNTALGALAGSELEGWGLLVLEVCPQLQLLKQPNTVLLALAGS